MRYYITKGTWEDAEQVCVDNGGHLWSVNSYSEWWNVMHIIGKNEAGVFSVQGMAMMGTTLLFIGLKKMEQVVRHT